MLLYFLGGRSLHASSAHLFGWMQFFRLSGEKVTGIFAARTRPGPPAYRVC
jgi:hypothetical protein